MSCTLPCQPKCIFAGFYAWDGNKMMLAQPGNKRFKTGEPHPECMQCARPRVLAAVRQTAAEEAARLRKTGELDRLTVRELADLHERITRGL